MPRPPEKKVRILLSELAGEVTIAEAARKECVAEVSISKWRNEFLNAGKHARGVRTEYPLPGRAVPVQDQGLRLSADAARPTACQGAAGRDHGHAVKDAAATRRLGL